MADNELFLTCQIVEDTLQEPTNSVDPTLVLPHHLLHSIYSSLSFRDLVHVSLVSKNWHHNTPSHFAFDFNESPHEVFHDRIRSSLDVSKSKLINADKRLLRLQYCEDHRDTYDVMRLLDGNDFHEVYLRIELLVFAHICYDLPYIFQSKSLTVLHLTNCGLDKHVLPCGEQIMPSLQELKLERVTLSEETLSKLISKYPYIKELSLVNCWKISFIVLINLDFLKKLYVISECHSFNNIQVIAPSLQVFHFVSTSGSNDVNVIMDIRSCKRLQEFHLDCWKFPKGLDPENFCSDFPHLETLLLGPCQSDKPLKISGPLLRKWILSFPRLYECSRKSIVSSPNLSSFEYMGTTFQPYLAPPSDTSKLLESSNIVLVPNSAVMNNAWFLKLRSHLENFSNYNTTLDIRLREEMKTGVRGHPAWNKPIGRAPSKPLHHIKHLMLEINKLEYQLEYLMRYFIDNLLWMSRPDTLTLSIPTSYAPLAHEVSKKLYSRRDRNCCSSTRDKCWRHFLKHFEVKEEVTDEKEDKLTKLIFIFTWRFNVVFAFTDEFWSALGIRKEL